MEPMEGLVAAVYTPFTPGGALNLDRVADQAALLAQNGVSHVFVAGTTGEGMLLSSDERRELVEEWTRCRGDLGLVVHVGHVSLVEAQALATHAGGLAVDALAAMAPPFFTPSGLDELVAWCADVAAAAGDKPFLFYHIPSLNMSLDAVRYVERVRDHIPTFRGIKYTHNDLMEAARLNDAFGDELDILAGRDEFHVPFLSLGAR
ncbi:MAG: dihydrodipicolinate synthase family protein, partial [Planctomycetes bacterium]|nr:dihydrodipicolinate synthase family protein [Planctomycetota bacterium]